MFLNLNTFGYDLEIKFRKKEHQAVKVLLVPEEADWKLTQDIAEVLA